jgi:hypothetical protein
MESLLTGRYDPGLADSEGMRLCLDLGLVIREFNRPPTVANPIYKEILARQMSAGQQDMLPPREAFRWQGAGGALDMDSLLREFQKFWRRHSDIWEQKSDYTEAFPHLLLMAFLQRILNGGGRVEREYAAGRGRLDLAVEYEGAWNIIEIKLLHDYDPPELVREEGLEQIRGYRDRAAPGAPAYLMIFDRRSEGKKLPWEQRITWESVGDGTDVGADGGAGGVTVVGC